MTMSMFVSLVFADTGNESDSEDIPRIDVVFVIDSTGSMGDEIREVKMHIKNIIEELQNATPKPDMRVGFVAYRDYADQEYEYVFKIYILTDDIDLALKNLEEIEANGGGDYEEVVTIGLDKAINDMNWRDLGDEGPKYDDEQNPIFSNSTLRRMIFLIGDAPPRTDSFIDVSGIEVNPMDYKENIKDAKKERIVICTISGSGMSSEGVSIWKEIAEETFGEYEPLTYERQLLEEYVIEERLDEGWEEKARDSSDYDERTGTISTNNLHDFVSSNIQLQTETMGSSYEESVTHYAGTLGFFFDTADDGNFDSFYCKEKGGKVPFMQECMDNYFIDYDEDGAWDYEYNSTTDTLVAFGEIPDIPEEESNNSKQLHNPLLLLLLIAEGILLISVVIFLRRKK